MRVLLKLFFLTFVLFPLTNAAAPRVSEDLTTTPLDTSPLAKPLFPRRTSPYQIAVYTGYAGGNFFEASDQLHTFVGGFRLSKLVDENAWDLNAEINSPQNLIGLHFGMRQFFFNPQGWRPYYKIAAGTHLKASDGFANFVEIKRLQARFSAGLNDLWDTPVYSELGAALAVVGVEYFWIVGVNWSF